MGFILTCGRICVVIINVLFLIIGLVFFVAGMVVKFGDSLLKQYYQPIIDSLETSLNSTGYGNVDLSSFSISELVGSLAIFFIVFGLFVLIISFCGCLGACCKQKILIIVYAVMVIVVLVAEIIFVGILYGKPELVQDEIKNPLKSAINTDYKGLNGTNVVSLGWNFVHQNFKCCGVDSYSDFANATNWLTDYGGTIGTLQAPLACCKTLPSTQSEFSCATAPTSSNNYLDSGCFDAVWNLVMGNIPLVAGVLAGFGVIQLLLIIFACLIFCDARNGGKRKIHSA